MADDQNTPRVPRNSLSSYDQNLLDKWTKGDANGRPYDVGRPLLTYEHNTHMPYSDMWVADVPLFFQPHHPPMDHAFAVRFTQEDAEEWAVWKWQQVHNKVTPVKPEVVHVYHNQDHLDEQALQTLRETLPDHTVILRAIDVQDQDIIQKPSVMPIFDEDADEKHLEWLQKIQNTSPYDHPEDEEAKAKEFFDPDDSSEQAHVSPLTDHNGQESWILWSMNESDWKKVISDPNNHPDFVSAVCPLRFATQEQAADAANALGFGKVSPYGLDPEVTQTVDYKTWNQLSPEKKSASIIGHNVMKSLGESERLMTQQNWTMTAPATPWFASQDLDDLDASWKLWRAKPGVQGIAIEYAQPDSTPIMTADDVKKRYPDAVLWPDSQIPTSTISQNAKEIPLSLMRLRRIKQPGELVLGHAYNEEQQTSAVIGWTHPTQPDLINIIGTDRQGALWQEQRNALGHQDQPLQAWQRDSDHTSPPIWTAAPHDYAWVPLTNKAGETLRLQEQHLTAGPDTAAQYREQIAAQYQSYAEKTGCRLEVTTITPQHNPIPDSVKSVLEPLIASYLVPSDKPRYIQDEAPREKFGPNMVVKPDEAKPEPLRTLVHSYVTHHPQDNQWAAWAEWQEKEQDTLTPAWITTGPDAPTILTQDTVDNLQIAVRELLPETASEVTPLKEKDPPAHLLTTYEAQQHVHLGQVGDEGWTVAWKETPEGTPEFIRDHTQSHEPVLAWVHPENAQEQLLHAGLQWQTPEPAPSMTVQKQYYDALYFHTPQQSAPSDKKVQAFIPQDAVHYTKTSDGVEVWKDIPGHKPQWSGQPFHSAENARQTIQADYPGIPVTEQTPPVALVQQRLQRKTLTNTAPTNTFAPTH